MSVAPVLMDDGKQFVLTLGEKFDFSTVQDFRTAYMNLPDTVNRIVIDLKKTIYIDSSALGMLLNMQKSLAENDYEYSIINCRSQVARIFKISRFDKKFDISEL